MKRVSLKAKLPGLCVAGAAGAMFLLSPLGAFAKCGGGGGGGGGTTTAPAAPVASIKSVEPFSQCSQKPLSATQANTLLQDGWATTTQSTKATIGSSTGTTSTTTNTAPPALTPAQLKSISFLAGNASCSFTTVDPTGKVNLSNGDMFLAQLAANGGKSASQPVFGIVIGGKLVFFTGNPQTGVHFQNVIQNPNVVLTNATIK